MNKRSKASGIRIIAGSWRGRRLPVLDSPGLRPTSDRVRETLFNWLMHDVAEARCLDLFAGSGVLGLECLSRGASHVHFVESTPAAALLLKQNLQALEVVDDRVLCQQANALTVLASGGVQPFDLVFLDPPFNSDLLEQSLNLLVDSTWLAAGALVYIESDVSSKALTIPQNWSLHREGSAGQSRYALYRV